MGLLLCLALLGAGRLVRHHMLLGPEGQWRQELWLDDLLEHPADTAKKPPARPVLTAPLPINRCSADSLDLLPGVGPVLAGRIAAAREAGLVFRAAGDLARVKGIGKVLTARLTPLVDFAPPLLPLPVDFEESR